MSSVATSSPSTTQNRRWSIEKIVKHVIDKNGDKMKFFVQWEGYGRRFDSWEPFENIKTATTRLYEYYDRITEEEVKKIKQCRLMMKRAARAAREGKSLTPQLLRKATKRKAEEETQETPRGSKKRRDDEDEEGGEEPEDMAIKRVRGRPRNDARERSSSTISTRSVATPVSMKKVKMETEEIVGPGEEDEPSTSACSITSVTTPSRSRRIKVDAEEVVVAAEECTTSGRKSTKMDDMGKNTGEDYEKDVKEEDTEEKIDNDFEEAKEEMKEEDPEDQILENNEEKEEAIDTITEQRNRDESDEIDREMKTPEEMIDEDERDEEKQETDNEVEYETDEGPSTSASCLLSSKAETYLKQHRIDWKSDDRKKDAVIDEDENPRVLVIGMERGTVLSEDEEEIIVLRSGERACQRPPILERRDKSKNEIRRRKAERPEKITRDVPDCETSNVPDNVIKKKKKKRGPIKKIKGAEKDDSALTGSSSIALNSAPSVIAAPTIDKETKGKKIEKMETLLKTIVEKKRKSEEFNEKEGEREKSGQLMEKDGEDEEHEDMIRENEVPEEMEDDVNLEENVGDNEDGEMTEGSNEASESFNCSGIINEEMIEREEEPEETEMHAHEKKDKISCETPEMKDNEEVVKPCEESDENELNDVKECADSPTKNEVTESEENEKTVEEEEEDGGKHDSSGTIGSGFEDVPEYLEEERAGPSTSSGLIRQPRNSHDPSDEEQEDVDLPDVIPDSSTAEIVEMKEEMASDGELDNYLELVRGGEAERTKRTIKKRQVFSPSR